ncbi:hypothetical protein LTR17_015786 [Elasticomyces elasticus]|nr:hypothetical protein LTR17_015786 [Elasticomyces elasticus]
MAASANPLRTYVITGAVAAITATGAWYGAGLKAQQEYKQEVKAVMEAPLADRIEQMEMTKARLLAQRAELQAKIDRLARRDAGAANPTPSSRLG